MDRLFLTCIGSHDNTLMECNSIYEYTIMYDEKVCAWVVNQKEKDPGRKVPKDFRFVQTVNKYRYNIDMDEVIALRKEGWTMKAIGEKMFCSGTTIGSRLREYYAEHPDCFKEIEGELEKRFERYADNNDERRSIV